MSLWQIEEDAFHPDKLRSLETVYTIGNGYFGTRGSFEEGYPKATPATLLEGVFDRIDIGKEELANVPDWLPIKLFVNGERFWLKQDGVLSYRRVLDMRHAVLSREVHWRSAQGVGLRVTIERFASLADEHVGVIRYSVTRDKDEQPFTDPVEIVLSASLNLAVGNHGLMHFEPVAQNHDGEISWLHSQTRISSVQLAQTMSFSTSRCDFQKELIRSDITPMIRFYGQLAPGETLTAEKVVVMFTSRDVQKPLAAALEHHHHILRTEGALIRKEGHYYTLHVEGITSEQPCRQVHIYDTLFAKHEKAWQRYWDMSDVIIEGDEKAQRAIRYNLYQLRLSDPAHDNRYSIAAKGLTGFGYHGHVFHDTEIFMLPYFTFVHPDLARNLLLYRYRLLPAARAKARLNGYDGAQIPWESTLDGGEATPGAIVHPESGELIPVLNGSIELHITSSVAYAFWHYWYVTGDDEFMRQYGAELLLSTAMFWVSRVTYDAARGKYEINNVIGPDEWHEHVNNDAYTNVMARWNIATALDTLDWLKNADAPKAGSLLQQLQLHDQELQHWREVIEHIRIPQDKQSGLFEQFDGFFKLEHLDQEKYPGRKTSYQGLMGVKETEKYQIIKQADVLMLLTILGQRYDLKTKRVNWDYYYPITDHDYGSSLTPAMHVILACELGLIELAYDLFMKSVLMDLEDLRGNTDEGIHDASCGAVWQAAIMGFAGLSYNENGYTTNPSWPGGWTRLAFKWCHKGQMVEIDLRKP